MEDIQLTTYEGGCVDMALMQKKLSYEELLSRVHRIVCANLNSFVYVMTSLCNIGPKIARFKINNDKNVQCILGQAIDKPEVYVIVLLI